MSENGPSTGELLKTLQEIKNKINKQSKNDDQFLKLLLDQVSELATKLSETQDPLTSPEYVFLKDKIKDLEDKMKQSQQQVVLLQKILKEQLEHKSRMQAIIYTNLEHKYYNKISNLYEIQKYLKPGSGHVMSLEECKQQDLMWKSCLRQLGDSKLRFEDYISKLGDLIFEEKYNLLRAKAWPEMPQEPQVTDGVYNSFKKILQSEVSQLIISHPKKAEVDAARSAPPAAVAAAARVVVVDTPSVWPRIDKPLANYDGGSPSWDGPHSIKGKTTGSSVEQWPGTRRGAEPIIDVASDVALPNTPLDDKCSSLSRTELVLGSESEQEYNEFLKSKFQNVGDTEWLEALIQVRDSHGGNLTRIPPDVMVHEIQKIIKQMRAQEKKKPAWSTNVLVSNSPKEHKKLKDDQCIICFEKMKPSTSYILACKHEFHKTCIGNWLKRTNQCPICRANVEKEDYPELPAPMSQ